jgi:hypothetical protein
VVRRPRPPHDEGLTKSPERDVRNPNQAAQMATRAYSNVWITGLPETYGQGASNLTAAAIEPVATDFKTGWDAASGGNLDYTATCTVTLLARHPDPQLRDELAEQLLDYLANSVNGQSLAGFTLPEKTIVTGWRWQSAAPPERRIAATVSFAYLVRWDSFDTSQ